MASLIKKNTIWKSYIILCVKVFVENGEIYRRTINGNYTIIMHQFKYLLFLATANVVMIPHNHHHIHQLWPHVTFSLPKTEKIMKGQCFAIRLFNVEQKLLSERKAIPWREVQKYIEDYKEGYSIGIRVRNLLWRLLQMRPCKINIKA